VQLEVKSYMTGQPISIEPDASALAALDLMVEHGIRHLPVVDPARRVCGVLSFDDLRAALPVPLSLAAPLAFEERSAVRELAVGEVMTYSPQTIRYDAPLEEAAERMAAGRFGCLPVVDENGQLDGILSETDLLYALITALWAARGRESAPAAIGFAEALEKERSFLVRKLADYERHEQQITETRRELPLDLAEQGSETQDARLTEQLAELASRRLRAIEHALEREERGELATCETCSGPIPEARLRALPGTTLCVRCARQAETGR
jgi:acetoin utilization protein AcuB